MKIFTSIGRYSWCQSILLFSANNDCYSILNQHKKMEASLVIEMIRESIRIPIFKDTGPETFLNTTVLCFCSNSSLSTIIPL